MQEDERQALSRVGVAEVDARGRHWRVLSLFGLDCARLERSGHANRCAIRFGDARRPAARAQRPLEVAGAGLHLCFAADAAHAVHRHAGTGRPPLVQSM